MERNPRYDLRDYPTGVSDFVNTFPPERRNEVLPPSWISIFEERRRKNGLDNRYRGCLNYLTSFISMFHASPSSMDCRRLYERHSQQP